MPDREISRIERELAIKQWNEDYRELMGNNQGKFLRETIADRRPKEYIIVTTPIKGCDYGR